MNILKKVDSFLDKVAETSSSMTKKEAKEYFDKPKDKVDSGFYGHFKPQSLKSNNIRTTGGC